MVCSLHSLTHSSTPRLTHSLFITGEDIFQGHKVPMKTVLLVHLFYFIFFSILLHSPLSVVFSLLTFIYLFLVLHINSTCNDETTHNRECGEFCATIIIKSSSYSRITTCEGSPIDNWGKCIMKDCFCNWSSSAKKKWTATRASWASSQSR